ncbi:hypothetical protein [Roseobacter weihaiensis]|uniref:hypothetical protein n=1 Tax=Roseobacter weihaiensis TaxID=2763262 RepID=UPI001D0AAD83|nr:hypothetical protein [Roseobacter sp. H9]
MKYPHLSIVYHRSHGFGVVLADGSVDFAVHNSGGHLSLTGDPVRIQHNKLTKIETEHMPPLAGWVSSFWADVLINPERTPQPAAFEIAHVTLSGKLAHLLRTDGTEPEISNVDRDCAFLMPGWTEEDDRALRIGGQAYIAVAIRDGAPEVHSLGYKPMPGLKNDEITDRATEILLDRFVG